MDSQSTAPPLARRRFVELILGTGLIASAVSFLYPILKYLIPPNLPDFGNEAVLAARVSEIKPKQGKIFRFGSKPGLLIESTAQHLRSTSQAFRSIGCSGAR